MKVNRRYDPSPVPGDDAAIGGYLTLLAAIGQDFAMSLDLDETLRLALTRIMDYLQAEAASIFLLENRDTEVVCQVCVGASDISGLRLKFGQGIVGQSIAEQASLMVRDVRDDPRFFRSVDEKTGFTTRSILCAPVSVNDVHLGAIEVVNKRGGDGLFEERDRQALRALAASAALAIRNARLTQSVIEQKAVQREIELVAELQQTLLPKPLPAPFPVHGVNLPARTVSGDFYDYFALPDGRIYFALGDVAGKGVQATLLMAKASSLVRCLGKSVHRPGELVGIINREICETASRGMFVTLVVGLYDPRTRRIRLANAGHEPPLHLAADGSFASFPAEAPPVGVSTDLFPDGRFPETEFAFDSGSLYVFSDGATEGRGADGETLGIDGVKAMLQEIDDLPVEARLDLLTSRYIAGGDSLHDDLTFVIVDAGTAGGGGDG